MVSRVLVFMADSNWGGPHNVVSQVAAGLKGRGYEVVVAFNAEAGTAAERYENTSVEIFRVPIHRIRRFSGLIENVINNTKNLIGMIGDVRRLRKLIRVEKISVVQVAGVMAIQAGIAAWLERKPIVWQIHGLVTPWPIMAVYMPFIVAVSQVIMSVGALVADRHFLVNHARRLICFLPPVNINRYAPDERDRNITRQSLGYTADDFVVGIVGNRNPAKAHEYFVRIAKLSRERGQQFKFIVVGQSTKGSAAYYKRYVTSLAETLNLLEDGALRFIEPTLGIDSYMRAFDAFVLTSRTEGMPTVLLEAMATGLPTISFNVGSVSEILSDSVGRMVEVGEIDRVCEILEMYRSDPELAKSIGAAARAVAEREFGIDRCVERHFEALELASGGSSAAKADP